MSDPTIHEVNTNVLILSERQKTSDELHTTRHAELKDRLIVADREIEILKKSLSSMSASLVNLKYVGYGALGLYMTQTVGLDKALKMWLGVG